MSDEESSERDIPITELDTYKMKISNAIGDHGFTDLLDDKILAMVTAIVASKLKFSSQRPSSQPKSAEPEFGIIDGIKLLPTILGIILLSIILYGIFAVSKMAEGAALEGPAGSKKSGDAGAKKIPFPDDSNAFVAGNFEFKRGSLMTLENYAGREEIIKEHVKLITEFVTQINILSKPELDKLNAYTKQNFLLEGPPGTGKTLFVRRIITLLDVILKEKYILEGKAGNEIKEKYEKAQKADNQQEKNQILNSILSRVLFCDVAPSSINNMYVGQSEKNVGLLFDTAYRLAEDHELVVFLFFDEGDVFFEERSGSAGQSSSSGNVKSELLQRIGQMPKLKYFPVFIYCATNRIKAFDDAFKRRFGKQDKFDCPSTEERRILIRSLLEDFEGLDEEIVEGIVSLTVGKSQAYISGQMKNFYIFEDWKVKGFKIKEFMEHLARNKTNKNLG